MRLVPRHWHNETWICSIRGHVTPGADAAMLRPEDDAVAVDVAGPAAQRFARCLRCDTWLNVQPPDADHARWQFLPPISDLALPRRGKQLQDAILLRFIAINKAMHAAAFGLLAVTLGVITLKLPLLKNSAEDLESMVNGALDSAGRNPARQAIATGAHRVLGLDAHDIHVLLGLAMLYTVVESIEAIGLWKERRWAEYVTAIATAGFLPLELVELFHRVTVMRIGALVINIAMLVWLVWNKHLFGIRGGEHSLHERTSWADILSTMQPARGRHRK